MELRQRSPNLLCNDQTEGYILDLSRPICMTGSNDIVATVDIDKNGDHYGLELHAALRIDRPCLVLRAAYLHVPLAADGALDIRPGRRAHRQAVYLLIPAHAFLRGALAAVSTKSTTSACRTRKSIPRMGRIHLFQHGQIRAQAAAICPTSHCGITSRRCCSIIFALLAKITHGSIVLARLHQAPSLSAAPARWCMPQSGEAPEQPRRRLVRRRASTSSSAPPTHGITACSATISPCRSS